MAFAIQDIFFPGGQPIEPLESVMSDKILGPHKLKIEIVMEREGTYPEECRFCPRPEEGCNEPENYLKYCYPLQHPDVPDLARSWVRLLIPPGSGLDHRQLTEVRILKRYAKTHEEIGTYVDIFPVLDHVEIAG